VPDILRNLTGLLQSSEPLAIFNHRNDDRDFEPIYRLQTELLGHTNGYV
jgi:hypothetical protein